MNAYLTIKTDLQSFIKKALKFRIIQNPRISGSFFDSKNTISSKHTIFINEVDYLSQYTQIYENGEYICALMDGSFFQIYYEFNIESKYKSYIKKMNLCYLPAVSNSYLLNHYIRIDYDDSVKNSFLHPIAHLHIGFVNSFRIPLSELMLFSDFFEFIIYCFYHDEYKLYFRNSLPNELNYKEEYSKFTKKIILAEEFKNHFYLNTKTSL